MLELIASLGNFLFDVLSTGVNLLAVGAFVALLCGAYVGHDR